jgi:diadenosine tetraphosphate (Ap4A) HIT family hydrolase
MEKDLNCAYCAEGELVEKFGIKICELNASKVYLFKEQSHEGRVIVAHKKHVSELIDLSEEERNDFFADVDRVAKALHAAFHPDKINYGAYGDTVKHLHFHLVPKYMDGYEWGTVFAMNPDRTRLSAENYNALITKIKTQLGVE